MAYIQEVAIHSVALNHSFSTEFYITSNMKSLSLSFEALVGSLHTISFNT